MNHHASALYLTVAYFSVMIALALSAWLHIRSSKNGSVVFGLLGLFHGGHFETTIVIPLAQKTISFALFFFLWDGCEIYPHQHMHLSKQKI